VARRNAVRRICKGGVNIPAVMFTAHNGEKIKKNIFIMRVEEEKSGLLSWTLL
jgi:hypothetical protein